MFLVQRGTFCQAWAELIFCSANKRASQRVRKKPSHTHSKPGSRRKTITLSKNSHIKTWLAMRMVRGVRGLGHALLAAGNDDLRVARRDLLGGERHRAQARAAELVDAEGGALDRDARDDGGLAGGVLAGAGGQNAIGWAVVGGMLSATVLAIFFVPLFFLLVKRVFKQDKAGSGQDRDQVPDRDGNRDDNRDGGTKPPHAT